jgi:putative transposase
LPKYLRRVPSIDALIPALYLKGVSTGDFTEALAAILGESARGLSATNIVRLKASWEQDYQAWRQRDLSQKRYVYWWADGVYFNVRLEDARTCVLVLVGATEEGTKELLAIVDGFRESKDSWADLLRDLKAHGLTQGPKLAIADGSLGFWRALQEEFEPGVAQQRCWVHKTANVLDKLPKSVQGRAKEMLHDMYLAPARQEALAAYDRFLTNDSAQIPKGLRLPGERQGHALHFLRLPGRALAPPAHHQPDRIDLRYRAIADESAPRAAAPESPP